jgi:RNA polymerase sigma-70 factor
MAAMSLENFLENYRDTIHRLYSISNASAWHVSESSFTDALKRSCERRFGAAPAPDHVEVTRFLDSLHVADLALAVGCLLGDTGAWDHLVSTYRAPIDAFAHAALGSSSRAVEIADSLWADLYGIRATVGARRSPLEHYGGRSSLLSWMRVVVTRLEADRWRATHRMEPLDADRDGNSIVAAAVDVDSPDPDRAKLIAALDHSIRDALNALSPTDRLRLSYYYVQNLTLAETAALTGEHESTTSRNLARARTAIRDSVTRTLRREYRFSDDQINQCFEYATGDWPFDLGRMLVASK